jgi:nicotinate-nucleotide pyrophosphorylase (carboxylating)
MTPLEPPLHAVRAVVATALAEDLGVLGDITTAACIAPEAEGVGRFVARSPGVVAGRLAVVETYRALDAAARVEWSTPDGTVVEAGTELGRVRGRLSSILAGERVALNLLTHCSGVATLTRRYVEAVAAAGSRTRVRDTRKTTPGLRALEKAAVRAGGGTNHRDSLSDAVLVKDNHVAVVGITGAVAAARATWPGRVVEVECDTLEQVSEALAADPDLVLLDNMAPAEVQAAVELAAGLVALEVSGGVDLTNVAAYAATGVDFVAVGAITHSAPALDIGLDTGLGTGLDTAGRARRDPGPDT